MFSTITVPIWWFCFLYQVLRETINTESVLHFLLQLLVSLTCNDCRTPVRPRSIGHLNWTESAHVKPLISFNTVVLILIWNLPYVANLHWTQCFNPYMKFTVRSKLTQDSVFLILIWNLPYVANLHRTQCFNPYMKFTVRSKLTQDSVFWSLYEIYRT